jgi:hypothetical protein
VAVAEIQPRRKNRRRSDVPASGFGVNHPRTESLQTPRWREPDSNRRYRMAQPRFRGQPISPLLDHPLAEKSARTRTDSMTTPDASAGPMVRIRFPPAKSHERTGGRSPRGNPRYQTFESILRRVCELSPGALCCRRCRGSTS